MLRFLLLALVASSSGTLAAQPTDAVEIARFGLGVPVSVAWHPNGEHIFVVTAIHELLAYDADTLEPYEKIAGVDSIEVSPNGRWLLTQGDDGAALRPIDTLGVPALTGYSVLTFSPDPRWLAARTWAGTLTLLDAETLAVLSDTSVLDGWPLWRPDGQEIAWFSESHVLIWEVPSARSRVIPIGDAAPYPYWHWSPDGTKLMNFEGTPNVRIYDAETGMLLHTLRDTSLRTIYYSSPWLARLMWGADSRTYLVCYYFDVHADCGVRSIESGRLLGIVDDGTIEPSDAPGLDSAALSQALDAAIYDPETGRPVMPRAESQETDYFYSESPDGTLQAVTSWYSGEIRIVESVSRAVVSEWMIDDEGIDIRNVAWSHDATRIAVWTDRGVISTWDVAAERQIATTDAHMRFGELFAFSSDSALLAVTDAFGRIHIRLPDGEVMRAPHREGGYPYRLSWQPGGALLAANFVTNRLLATSPTMLTVWLVGMQSAFQLWSDQMGASFEWSPDGLRMAAVNGDTVSVWTVANGKILSVLTPTSEPARVEWSADSRTFMVWAFQSAKLVDAETVDVLINIQSRNGVLIFQPFTGNLLYVTRTGCEEDRCRLGLLVLHRRGQPARPGTVDLSRRIEPGYIFGELADWEINRWLWSPNQTAVLAIRDAGLDVWEIDPNGASLRFAVDEASNPGWSPDGHIVHFDTPDGVVIAGAQIGETLLTIPGVTSLGWRGADFLVCRRPQPDSECVVEEWDIARGVQVTTDDTPPQPRSPDGRYVVVVDGGVVILYDTRLE